ncbi:tetratricopeptide repeat protein [Echinicola soli]|uniref:Tetratricopeptide repeat protein n=1 Tax=Echinicola soli TaxID=2591634 RepID=A0A514CHQ4_9BACT|nr:tetratricopeptide repeat protein [Echinicola soli]QDH79367.1 tetratricopeptide repeat protein [Echinicola soli]
MKSLIFLSLALLSMTGITLGQDNAELQKMADADQQARFSQNIDWQTLHEQDSIRRKRVLALMEQGQVKTAKDHFNAGIIFQHGLDTIDSNLAVRCFGKAILMDSTLNKWWYAAAVDRDLMRKDKSQVYGTQFIQDPSTGKFKRYKIDSAKISDQERQYYGVETLAQQREKERLMNLKSISTFYAETNSIDKTIALINSEFIKKEKAEYNVSEIMINGFGYGLMNAGKNQEALNILKLNTELYPEAANTYDSFGEILLKLGKTEEGVKNYKKSLELNPDNENAKRIVEQNQ